MILIFDLDHTLIDTEKLKADKRLLFGISAEEDALHNEQLFKNKNQHYNPEIHLQFLVESGKIKTREEAKKIGRAHQKLINKIDNYLFPGVEKMLADLKKEGHYLVLITSGDPVLQKSKVDNSRVKKHFDKIIYETEAKADNKFIKQLPELGQDMVIINDKASEALAMKKILGKKAMIFLVNGPNSKNISHGEKIHESVLELKDYLIK